MPGRDAPAPGPTASEGNPRMTRALGGWTGCATWTPWSPRRSAAAHAL